MTLASELRDVAIGLAREAGDMALHGRKTGTLTLETKSSPVDMVTQFDKASEDLITKGLAQLRPHDAIVGEEGADTKGTSGITWHIDPIDGTTNFMYDLPTWAVSIGAVDEHGPIAGAVYAPALGEMFSAARGEGAHVNHTPLAVHRTNDLSTALLATGFSYNVNSRGPHTQRVARMLMHVRDLRRMGAAAIDLCFVAAGRLDAYFEEGLNSWDLVAGQLIATEAGAVVTNFAGEAVTPSQVLACSPELHAAMVRFIQESSHE
jgi:myo-inositol-1(or 4)-monophosphatase